MYGALGNKPTQVEVTEYDLQNSCWKNTEPSFQQFCSSRAVDSGNDASTNSPRPCTRFAFLPDDLPTSEARDLCATLRIPQHFFEPLAKKASGFYGSSVRPGASRSDEEGYQTWFRFLIKRPLARPLSPGRDYILPADKDSYDWIEIAFFTQWQPSEATVLCFGLPVEMREEMRRSLEVTNPTTIASSPYDAHAFILPFIVRAFDSSVWLWRDRVRDLEKKREANATSKQAFLSMHELSRHTIHSTEILTTASVAVRSMIEDQQYRHPLQAVSNSDAHTSRALHHQKTLLECLLNRSQALEKRLQNEINLMSNLNAQNDSRIAANIAELSRTDGRVMKTISILGLVFLPGTFISALFSMSFFNFQPATADTPAAWRVSEMFWIYWVVTVPVTLATIVTWRHWERNEAR